MRPPLPKFLLLVLTTLIWDEWLVFFNQRYCFDHIYIYTQINLSKLNLCILNYSLWKCFLKRIVFYLSKKIPACKLAAHFKIQVLAHLWKGIHQNPVLSWRRSAQHCHRTLPCQMGTGLALHKVCCSCWQTGTCRHLMTSLPCSLAWKPRASKLRLALLI